MVMENKPENMFENFLNWNGKLGLFDQGIHGNDLVELGMTQPELGECVKRFQDTFGENNGN